MWRILVMIAVMFPGTLARAEEMFEPQPRPLIECEDGFPAGIEGTWRVDLARTGQEYERTHPDAATTSVAGSDTGTTIITADSIVVEIPGIGSLARSYHLRGGSAHRYMLEIRDKAGATRITTIELVPCGLMMEAPIDCADAFCENAMDEVFEMVAQKVGPGVDPAQLKRDSAAARQHETGLQRTFYRQVLRESP